MTEKKTQNEVLTVWGSRDDMRLWRQNTGVAFYTDDDGRRRTVSFGLKGAADLSGIYKDGTRIEIECKKPGGRLSKIQRAYGEMIRKFGGVYIVVSDVHEVRAKLRAEGLDVG